MNVILLMIFFLFAISTKLYCEDGLEIKSKIRIFKKEEFLMLSEKKTLSVKEMLKHYGKPVNIVELSGGRIALLYEGENKVFFYFVISDVYKMNSEAVVTSILEAPTEKIIWKWQIHTAKE